MVTSASDAADFEHRSRRQGGDAVQRFLRVDDGLTVQMRDEIVDAHADLRRGPCGSTELIRNATGGSMPSDGACSSRQFLGRHAQPAATHATVLDDLVHHTAHHVHGNREADAVRAQRLGQDRGIDADQLAVAY